jgi:hypothetical protein
MEGTESMKTLEQWREHFLCSNTAVTGVWLRSQLEAVQADAIAHGREIGLREAAEICNYTGQSLSRNIILAAIDKKG